MFTLSSPDPDLAAASGLLVLTAEGVEVGAPLERVGLTRDELANLTLAVQHRYTKERGGLVEPRDAWLKIAPEPTRPGDLPLYQVQTDVPNHWFPLVPEPVRPDAIRFRLVELLGTGLAGEPAGRLIEKGLWLHEEEVPRYGAWVQRRPVLARWFDGSWHTWVRREKNPVADESSSELAFDTVRPTDPGPTDASLLAQVRTNLSQVGRPRGGTTLLVSVSDMPRLSRASSWRNFEASGMI
jgi:hypothetical protein